ncbi:unnamed protein product [Parascedosporium putredinis]|uniref:Glucanase n=1 Tax=Parascedosporium putredinis TaxID=1442378 RepID=A0A9P1M725_9PEZI|nr:unnamed protein product [Parascedosporium putredinis]CAI7989624.1 unnamed protein product [Parascedosporium putredinis]
MYQILVLLPLGFAAAQHVGREQAETHPVLEWKRCQADNTCETVTGEITVDSNWRWVHRTAGFVSCIEWNQWTDDMYDVDDPNPGLTYAEECAIEGADYERSYGVATKNNTLSQKYRTNIDFSTNYNSRLFLLESRHKYQMFTLLDNELAFDVDLSTVDCGLNSALHFVAMDPDGARPSTLAIGLARSTGPGTVMQRAPEVLGSWGNSNANSYSTSAHVCREDEYYVCEGADDCNGVYLETELRLKRAHCDLPAFEGFPGRSDLDSEYCESLFKVFGDDDYYSELGGSQE